MIEVKTMIKYICDKCGKEMYQYDEFEVAITPPLIGRYEDKRLHLCEDCIKGFDRFLKDDTKIYEIR